MTAIPDPSAYLGYLESMTADSVAGLRDLVASDILFIDPFRSVRGFEAFQDAHQQLFRVLDAVRITVTDRAWSGRIWLCRFNVAAHSRALRRDMSVDGVAELEFDDRGLVAKQVNHWDSGGHYYAALPVVGTLVRMAQRRISGE